MSDRGMVSLVGAGPGDPGLITVKALECIKQADVIVYDRLVNATLLDHAKPGCETIFVGKSPTEHAMSQPDINSLLVSKATEGKYVVRLKGGDPFLFGRGGEEAETLVKENISFDAVPGVSSAIAVPAYAGIPVTHRQLSSSVTIVTGHEDPTKAESSIDWKGIAQGTDTIVILMGMGNLSEIVDRLADSGRSLDTPVALIRDGTLGQQKTLEGTLADIVKRVDERGFSPPAIVVVGDVVKLREELSWFESRPLFGKRILVTRSRKQASALSTLLTKKGAEVIELPALEINQTPGHARSLDRAIDRIRAYQWVVFTSVNGVQFFFERLESKGLYAKALEGIKIGAIGPATAEALENKGVTADFVPQEYVSEAIVEWFRGQDIQGKEFLLPRADKARAILVDGLRELGAEVDQVPVYSASSPSVVATQAMKRLSRGDVDIVTFASSSTVKNLVQMLNGHIDALKETCVACIGPITAATARDSGLKVDILASEHTIPGLVDAIVRYPRSLP